MGGYKQSVPGEQVCLWTHPNFSMPEPIPEESPIDFAVRAAAHLISPPKEPGEHYDIECDEIARQLIEFSEQIKERWNGRNF